MSLVLTVMKRELLSRPRLNAFFKARMGLPIVAGIVVIAGFLLQTKSGGTAMGAGIFRGVSLLMIPACFAATLIAAPLLAKEREERTLGLLFIANVRPWQIVIGKLVQALLTAIVMVLSVLPMLLLCVGLGGVSTSQVLKGMVIGLTCIVFGSCVGLGISSISRTERSAIALGVAVSVLLIAVIPALTEFLCDATDAKWIFLQTISEMITPYYALAALSDSTFETPIWRHCVFNVLGGIPFLMLAFFLVPTLALEKEGRASSRGRSSKKGVILRGNPVVWMQRLLSLSGRKAWLLCAVTCAGTLLISLYAYGSNVFYNVLDRAGLDDFGFFCVAAVAVVCAAIAAIGAVESCAVSFNRDKKSRTFELLLITGLSEAEIILGKLWACLKTFLPWVVCACGSVLLLTLWPDNYWPGYYDSLPRIETALLMIAVFITHLLGCAGMALYSSLRYRAYVTIGITALTYIPWLLISGAVVFSMEGGAMLFCILWNLVLAYVGIGKLFHRLRQIANGEKLLV